jgi:hypothetical protein
MKPSVFIAFFFFCLTLCASAENDSLLRFSDLTFKNATERNSFLEFQQKGRGSEVLDLFLGHYSNPVSYSSEEALQRIGESVREIQTATRNLNDQKKVRYIHQYIHKHYFKVYKTNNSFSDIFTRGEYNCLSGSALYAMVFDRLDIPYQVAEAPNHVFLYAYPRTHKIMIETTSPKNGYLRFSDQYIQKYLGYMSEAKLISREELESTPPGELFDRYYFSGKGLNIFELAGAQYNNYTYYHLEEENTDKALEEAKKAYYLFPGERSKYLLRSLLIQSVSNSGYKDRDDFGNLALLCRFNQQDKKEVSDEAIRQEFIRLTHEQLISRSDYEQYAAAFEQVSAAISDSSLKSRISFIYHYELGRLGYGNGRNTSLVIPHLKAAYDINPKNAELQMIIKASLLRAISEKNNLLQVLGDLQQNDLDFDFLAGDEQVNIIRANCLLELAYQAYSMGDALKGSDYLKQHEHLYTEKQTKAGETYIEKAYSSAATFYFRKGDKAKTRELLKTALDMAPGNFGLQVRYNQVR